MYIFWKHHKILLKYFLLIERHFDVHCLFFLMEDVNRKTEFLFVYLKWWAIWLDANCKVVFIYIFYRVIRNNIAFFPIILCTFSFKMLNRVYILNGFKFENVQLAILKLRIFLWITLYKKANFSHIFLSFWTYVKANCIDWLFLKQLCLTK